MNITQAAKVRAEVIKYLKQARDAKLIGFDSVARTHAATATGYAHAAFDLRVIDSVTYTDLINDINDVILSSPVVTPATLDTHANV